MKQVNLIEYIPYELRKYLDYQVLYDSENPEFTKCWSLTQQLIDELYIVSMSDFGLSKLEKMLRITPHSSESLEDRRIRILSYWNNEIPYTWRVLLQNLNSICGVGQYEIKLINDEYRIKLDTKMETQSQYDSLVNLLQRVIPCNIVYLTSNELSVKIKGNVYTSIVMLESKSHTIKE